MANINIHETIRQIKEYQKMQDELKKELEELKREAIEYMTDIGVDEITVDEGKCTWREVLSKRFASTDFKKDFPDIYEEYRRTTSSMRFTCS